MLPATFPALRLSWLLAVSAVSVLLLTGCGGGSSASTEAPVVPSSTRPAADAPVPTDLCDTVTAEQVSEALGLEVGLAPGPGGDCEFTPGSTRGLRGSVGVVAAADSNGGYAGYVAGLDGTIKDPTSTELTGLGDAAVVKVGLPAVGGSENNIAAGVVDHGTFLVQVTLTQGARMSGAELAAAAEKLLRLVESHIV